MSIDEWNKLGGHKVSFLPRWCFRHNYKRPVIEKKPKAKKSHPEKTGQD